MSKNRLSLTPRLPLHNTIFTKPFRWNCIWFLFKNDLVRYTFWLILIYLFIRFFMSINSTCLDFKMLRFSYLSSSYCKIRLRALLIEWFKRVEHAVDKPLTKAMHLGPFIEWFIAIGWSNYYHFIYVSHVLLYRLLKFSFAFAGIWEPSWYHRSVLIFFNIWFFFYISLDSTLLVIVRKISLFIKFHLLLIRVKVSYSSAVNCSKNMLNNITGTVS